jgi:hypothetical protein
VLNSVQHCQLLKNNEGAQAMDVVAESMSFTGRYRSCLISSLLPCPSLPHEPSATSSTSGASPFLKAFRRDSIHNAFARASLGWPRPLRRRDLRFF